MRAYIVDDERLAVERLTRLLDATGRVTIAGASTDPETALEFLRGHAVDVLFLDIQMPGMTGFELLDRLDRDVFVVFATAYDQYAIDAFTVNSIDYLLKPIEPERLDRALVKLERFAGQPKPDIRALARALATELGGAGPRAARGDASPLQRVASRVGERTTVLDVARISHFSSKDKLTFAVVNGREHVIDHTLTELESRLDPRRFVRIHRATILNIAFVQELYPGVDALRPFENLRVASSRVERRQAQGAPSESRGGGVLVRLKDDGKTELSVARDRVRELKERLGI